MAYLEFLVENQVTVNMVANNVSAFKAYLIMYSLDHHILEHPRVRYFTKAMKINQPLSLTKRNVITIEDLENISLLCEQFPCGVIFRAVLSGF